MADDDRPDRAVEPAELADDLPACELEREVGVPDEGAAWPDTQAALPAGHVTSLMSLYLRDVRRFSRLPADEERVLIDGMQQGSASARDALICHHLGLVISMARRFNHRGLDLLDLIEEGNLGMLVALRKFDPARGLRFSTYAGWWIRYYLQTAVATQVPIVRPPLRLQQRNAREGWQEWDQSHQPVPPAAGNADGDIAAAAVAAKDGALLRTPVLHARIALVASVTLDDSELDSQLSAAQLWHRDVADEVAEQHDHATVSAMLRALVARLPERQREIVVARFGLRGEDEYTLHDLSVRYRITRERVRQIQVEALQTLRDGLEQVGLTRDATLN